MSDRLFLDANVLLDHLLHRQPFANDAAELFAIAERSEMSSGISAFGCNIVYYLIRKQTDEQSARRTLSRLRDVFEIVAVDAQIIGQAIDSDFPEFEDAVQHACAVRYGATHLITRDQVGFRRSQIPALSPSDYLSAGGG